MGNCLCFYSVDWTVAIATIVITIYVGAHNKFTVEHNQPNGVLMVIASRTHKKRTEWMDERKKERKGMKENERESSSSFMLRWKMYSLILNESKKT